MKKATKRDRKGQAKGNDGSMLISVKKNIVLITLVLAFASGAAAGDFSGQVGASVRSVMIRFFRDMTINAMAYNAGGSGFYEFANSHKIGGSVMGEYTYFFSTMEYEYDEDPMDPDEIIYVGQFPVSLSWFSCIFVPAYRFEPLPGAYIQASLMIDAHIMSSVNVIGRSRHRYFFDKDFGTIYIAELSARYRYVGAAYGYILNDDYLARHIIRGSVFAPMGNRFELAPYISYRFGGYDYERLDFMIGINYVF